MDLTVEHDDGALLVATGPHLVVLRWTGAPSVDAMRLFTATNRRMQVQYPRGAALVNLVLSGTPSFDADFVDEAISALREVRDYRTATAHVIPTEGFAGVAVRSVLSTINLMGQSSRPVKVFRDVPSAAKWLTETLEGHPSRSWSQSGLERALAELCFSA